jgi:hypothetical protein
VKQCPELLALSFGRGNRGGSCSHGRQIPLSCAVPAAHLT